MNYWLIPDSGVVFSSTIFSGLKVRDSTAQAKDLVVISHLLGNFLGLKYISLIIEALSTNGAVHTSLGRADEPRRIPPVSVRGPKVRERRQEGW
jgi:hypothetical protein